MSHAFLIPDETYETLNEIAARQGRTPEEVFQQWVERMQREASGDTAEQVETQKTYDPQRDPLAAFLGAFEAVNPDVVRRHDEYLGETYGAERDSAE